MRWHRPRQRDCRSCAELRAVLQCVRGLRSCRVFTSENGAPADSRGSGSLAADLKRNRALSAVAGRVLHTDSILSSSPTAAISKREHGTDHVIALLGSVRGMESTTDELVVLPADDGRDVILQAVNASAVTATAQACPTEGQPCAHLIREASEVRFRELAVDLAMKIAACAVTCGASLRVGARLGHRARRSAG